MPLVPVAITRLSRIVADFDQSYPAVPQPISKWLEPGHILSVYEIMQMESVPENQIAR